MVQENSETGLEELEEGEELTLGRQVDELLEKGYSQKEIREQGFSPSLVRQRVRKRTKGLGKHPPAPENGGKNVGRSEVSLTVKEKEQVLPEWLESQVGELYDGDEKTRKIFMAGMSIPLLGMRLFSESFKPMLALMQTYQAGQAEAAKAAAGGSEEVAKSTIVEAMPFFKDMITEVSRNQAVNPLQNMMVRMMEAPLQGVMSNLFAGMFKLPGQQSQGQQGQGSLPPGWATSEKAEK